MSAIKKILITGGSGMLGHYLIRYFSKKYSVNALYLNHEILCEGCNKKKLDLLDRYALLDYVMSVKPHYIIHTAAITDIDRCEEDPNLAYNHNVVASRNICEAANKVGSKLIYTSTDSVFDGERGNYSESDMPHPINVYSVTKLEGEQEVLNNANNLVIRCALYGWHRYGNAHKSLPELVCEKLSHNEEVALFTDHIVTPIYAGSLAFYLDKMLDFIGVFHVATENSFTKFEVGLCIAEIFNLDARLIKKSVSSQASFFAKRPRDTSLSVSRLKNALSLPMPELRKDLQLMINDPFCYKN